MRARGIVVILGLALVVEIMDLTAWLGWRHVARMLESDPDRAAAALTHSALVLLPGFVQLGRRLDGRALEQVIPESAAAAFDRLGRDQWRWMPTDAAGPRNRSRALGLRGCAEEALPLARSALERFPRSPFVLRLVAALELELGERAPAFEHLADAEALAGGYRLPPIELGEEETRWLRLEALRRRLDLYPRREVTSRVELARELRARGGTEAAAETVSPVAGEPEVRVELARWDLERGDFDAVSARLQPVVADRGLPAALRSRALVVVAEARSASGDEDGALAAARDALRLTPGSPAPYVALARLAEARGDLPVALAYLRRAWGVAPDNTSILVDLARVAAAAGATQDARLALERAAELRPDEIGLAMRLVEHHLALGDLGSAALVLSSVRDRFPDDPRLIRLAERLQAELDRR